MVRHFTRNEGIVGSNPIGSFRQINIYEIDLEALMAYKPFKVNNGNTNYNMPKRKESKYQIERMKLFGFRSGIAWKMIPTLAYYILVGFILFSSIMGEIQYFHFEQYDVVLTILKYIFLFIMAYSPAIFLSDFGYNKKLPIFKGNSVILKTIAMIVILVFCYFMVCTYQYCMSDAFKESADTFYEQRDKEYQKQLEEYESESREQETATINEEAQ